MKRSLGSFFGLTALIFLAFIGPSRAQVTSSISSNETRTAEVARTQEAVNKVLLDSGISFNEGLLAFVDNRKSSAGEKFNKSVEVFLYSTLNIQKDPKL